MGYTASLSVVSQLLSVCVPSGSRPCWLPGTSYGRARPCVLVGTVGVEPTASCVVVPLSGHAQGPSFVTSALPLCYIPIKAALYDRPPRPMKKLQEPPRCWQAAPGRGIRADLIGRMIPLSEIWPDGWALNPQRSRGKIIRAAYPPDAPCRITTRPARYCGRAQKMKCVPNRRSPQRET